MCKSKALILTGAGAGLFFGSSMGLAVGGTAYNAALFLTPLGAFVGWLVASKIELIKKGEDTHPEDRNGSDSGKSHAAQNEEARADASESLIQKLFWSAITLLATLWNFHIDIIDAIGLLPAFVKQPLLFAGLCIAISVIFPPFLIVYFLAWLGANHFGLYEETGYRAQIK